MESVVVVPRALVPRVQSFLQIVETSEALLLEEIDELRAVVRRLALKTPVAVPVEDEYDTPRVQLMEVYVAERRLEHHAIRQLLDSTLERLESDHESRLVALEEQSDKITESVHDLSESLEELRMRIEAVVEENGQFRQEILDQKVYRVTASADLSVLSTRVDHIEKDFLTLVSSQDMVATEEPADAYLRQLECTLQQVQQEKLVILESLASVEERSRDEIERIRCELEEAYDIQDEQSQINIALRATIVVLREKNAVLVSCLRSRHEQLQKFLRRINALME